jgi:hypothetical protein
MFGICGERWFRRYIMGHKIPPAVAMILGTGAHASIEKNMVSVIETSSPITIEEVKDIARDKVTIAFEEGVSLSESEIRQGKKKVLAATVDGAVALGALHHGSVAPGIRPAYAERRWKIELTGFPYDLTGVVDIQETPEAGLTVIDTKTTGKSPTKTAADNSDQLTMYALAIKTIDGLNECPPLALDYLINTKVPKALRLSTIRSDEDVQRFVNRIEVMCEAIQKEVFLPAPRDSWQCTPRWCGYYDTCKYPVRGGRPKS